MSKTEAKRHFRVPLFQGILPIQRSRVPGDVIAGITLAALNIPQAMGCSKIVGPPVITGLYAILLPMTLFALFRSSRHCGEESTSGASRQLIQERGHSIETYAGSDFYSFSFPICRDLVYVPKYRHYDEFRQTPPRESIIK
jgi:hypothetical protein